MRYAKYHALGNDYIVIRPTELPSEFVPDVIRLVCHRNYGVVPDGILLGPVLLTILIGTIIIISVV